LTPLSTATWPTPASSTSSPRASPLRPRPARRRRSICLSGPSRRPTPPWWHSARSPQTTAPQRIRLAFRHPQRHFSPQVLGKQYNEAASPDMARTIAHRFADEIILRLGGGINGIAETKIYFVSSRSGSKEIWAMDYDGQNQHQVTHLGATSLSPRISPDNSASPLRRWAARDGPSACTRWNWTAWSPSRPARRAEATSPLHGQPTEPKLHSHPRVRAIRRFGPLTPTAATCAA
jgi:hypothetical protein